jgi:hypothetical protein
MIWRRMMNVDLEEMITDFMSGMKMNEDNTELKKGKTKIYNEFSLQHELGVYLRKKQELSSYKVQFERNIGHFNIRRGCSPKKEIDISIFKTEDDGNPDPENLLATIELKFLKNGQYPQQMFSICKDIAFMEYTTGCIQHCTKKCLKKKCTKNECGNDPRFEKAYVLVIACQKLFYEGDATKSPYYYFRPTGTGQDIIGGNEINIKKTLKNDIKTAEGKKINLKGKYNIIWKEIESSRPEGESRRYTLIEIS